MVDRNVSNKGPEAEFRIIALRMNCPHNLAKILERLLRHVVVAKRDIKAYVTRGSDFTLWKWTNRTEFDFTTMKT
jgi:hypothetical protein